MVKKKLVMSLGIIICFIAIRRAWLFCAGAIEPAVCGKRCIIYTIPCLVCFFLPGKYIKPERAITIKPGKTAIKGLQPAAGTLHVAIASDITQPAIYGKMFTKQAAAIFKAVPKTMI